MQNEKLKIKMVGAALILIAAVIIIWTIRSIRETTTTNLDVFARCLTEKGLVMYGSATCPHCLNEKNRFGEAFTRLNYVECLEEPKLCTAAGIEVVPTWVLADGQKLAGEQGLARLAEVSGCVLGD